MSILDDLAYTPQALAQVTVVIAAAIIAAVRLARDDISSSSPRIYAAVADSVSLARKILQRVIGG
jgi:hypothetical protein